MPIINELGPLSAYGEYTEEAHLKSAEKVFIPVNHLGNEASIYLNRQASSPVGWYTWGSEAFDTARREDRPVFLNIGYSSSHWCSVMDIQCFMNNEVAGLMNDSCIPVRVDREEHPDIDALFMEVCRTVQQGGL